MNVAVISSLANSNHVTVEYDGRRRVSVDCDALGRIVRERYANDTEVAYGYDKLGRVARQVVDGSPIDFTYTKYGQLAGKYLGGREKPDASVEYEYSKSGQIVARTANGVRQTYEYDGRGQLLAVKENGADVERYVYDKAGNMLRKTIRLGRAHTPGAPQYRTTTFTFDGANQLVSSTTDGKTTRYAYDAAGRLVREGDKTYRYGYLDKILSVTEGKQKYTYDYHVDGQLARANYGRAGCPQPAGSEDFLWDGLALIKRGDERFVNEPHVGGGNPVASSKDTTYFNDILGTTVGIREGRAPSRPKSPRYSAAALTAFGERMTDGNDSPASRSLGEGWFTGKPEVAGLGHTFLFRNYRAGLAKWQTADPLGYPDGWNQLAYCNNGVTDEVDLFGCHKIYDNILGYANSIGLGHWWKIVGECNGDPRALTISYTIIDYPANAPTAFDGPYDYNLKLPEKGIDIRITDSKARFSGFGYTVENEIRTPKIGKKIGDISYYTLEFDFVIHYDVKLSYTYQDPMTGEECSGSVAVTEYIRNHVTMTCFHKIME